MDDKELDLILQNLNIEDDDTYHLETLNTYLKIIDHTGNKSIVEQVFINDDRFINTFGFDVEQWKNNIEKYISEEKLRSLSFMRWGFKGLFSNAWLSSLGRLERVLQKNLEKIQTQTKDFTKRKSAFLPSYNTTMDVISGITDMGKLIDGFVKNPKSMKLRDIQDTLEKIGIRTGDNPELAESWSAQIGKVAARMYVRAATRDFTIKSLAKSLGIANNMEPINKRGWDSVAKIEDATSKMLNIIKNTNRIGENMKRLRDVDTSKLDEVTKLELKKINKLLKHATKAYINIFKYVARGLAGIV